MSTSPSPADDWPGLVKRIDRLESQNRVLKITSLLSLILLSGVLLMAQSRQARTLTAERFEIVDKAGKVRAGLGMSGNGPALLLIDESGKTRASLRTTETGSGLHLYDAGGETEAGAFEVDASSRQFRLYDKSGKIRAGLLVGGSNGKSGPALLLSDAGGNPRISLDVDEGPGLSILGSTGKPGLALSVDDKNNPGILLFDSSSKLRIELTAGDAFHGPPGGKVIWPGLFLRDPAGHIRASLFVSETGDPLLALSDAEGKVIFLAPPRSE